MEEIILKNDPFGAYFKIYSDGNHFVGTRILFDVKKSCHVKHKSDMDKLFDNLYFEAVKQNLRNDKLKEYIKTGLLAEYGEIIHLDNYLDKHIKSKIHNLYARLKRFRRKVNLNKWNYFTTITYDSEKMDEDTFRRKLRKCLSNLHTRRNWRYMGVFEFSPEENRLHFHAMMYIPNGEMVGKIFEEKSYSTKKKSMQVAHINTFFQKTFGRCDFASISNEDLKYGGTANYLTKYLNKTGEKIVYSRGILSEICLFVDNKDIATIYTDFVLKFVLFDDVISSEDIYTFRPPKKDVACHYAISS